LHLKVISEKKEEKLGEDGGQHLLQAVL